MKYHIAKCSDIYYLLSTGHNVVAIWDYVADSIGSPSVHPIRQYVAGDVR